MKITANGKETVLENELTVSALLVAAEVEMPEYVSVQINDEIILRADFETRIVKEGDVIDFLYYMGGGSVYAGA
jgi:sulfur carrier protein